MDPQAKKTALRAITYGLYVLTAADGDEFAAAGVNWLSQASFEPPLVMVGVKRDNDSHRLIERTGVFAVNVLGEEQLEIGKAFFRTTTVEGDRLNGYRAGDGVPTARRPSLLVRVPGHRHRRPRRPHRLRRRDRRRGRARPGCDTAPAARDRHELRRLKGPRAAKRRPPVNVRQRRGAPSARDLRRDPFTSGGVTPPT